MLNYRKVKCIELHNSKVALTTTKESKENCAYQIGRTIEHEIDTNDTIDKIECEIISSSMVNIRITANTKTEEYIEEICYCGSFAIWWLN